MKDNKQFISEILTHFGLCYTFNVAYVDDVLHMNSTSNDFHYDYYDLDDELVVEYKFVRPKSLPRKITSSFTGLQIYFSTLNIFYHEIFERNPNVHVIYIHDPFELPSMDSKMLNINNNQIISLVFDADLNTIDDSLVHYKPEE